ncbi:NADP-dependent malic enzyme, mitochondrial [Clonorchis sinensis]|uniref:Malic enzyme n=2 Tax=Clonorchis sinensis TaxID=79923 RepID=A0A8T1M9C4_CLOSI|nr:NADP-dependent malic enzyme, mitochondrial [Clonorchis sinensis]
MKRQFVNFSKLMKPQACIRNASRETKLLDLVKHHGMDVLRDPSTNKGTGFSLRERQILGIHGLVPPAVLTIDQQIEKMMINLVKMSDNLQRYSYLTALQDRNERLFYKLIIKHIEYCMPLIYTPTVGQACQFYGTVFRRPRGVYITIHDRHHVMSILNNWPEQRVNTIVFTDGERILGLGDLGAHGMGIPIGKLSLYTALAGVNPKHCLPVQLDVGTNNQKLLDDPFYTGIRHRRIQDERYDELVDNFMQAVVQKYGLDCLIQFEDFGNHNAFRLLERYKEHYCAFNDDIQGTAAVAVAGLLAAGRITKRKLTDNIYLFVGAGEAATGMAQLLAKALQVEGLSKKEACKLIYMADKDGLLVHDRPEGNLTDHNKLFARNDTEPIRDLGEIVTTCKPTTIIGASGQTGLFTTEILKQMTVNSDRPIIFALSNPTSKSECTAEEAYKVTEGRCVFASGSPFDPVEMEVGGVKQTFMPGQCNNAYIFPGIGLAITACHIRPISNTLFIRAAQSLAEQVTEVDLQQGRVFPPLCNIREVSLKIAESVAASAYQHDICQLYPKPKDLRQYLLGNMYEPDYVDLTPELYDWPPEAFGSTC